VIIRRIIIIIESIIVIVTIIRWIIGVVSVKTMSKTPLISPKRVVTIIIPIISSPVS
tara:strand:- start:4 stop:174 length:171 start_codon:yes stop_codon:yes gene_type:complete